jgi:membrane protease YdiL (CAAX protease family)
MTTQDAALAPTVAPLPSHATARTDVRATARRGLTIYFGVVLVLTGVLDTLIISAGKDLDSLALLTMFVPTIAAVSARRALHEGFRDVSFRIGGRRGWKVIGLTLLFPLAVGSVAYGIAWMTGLAQFVPLSVPDLAIPFLVLTLPSFILVSGEEIGWRGYMLTRLIHAGVPHPIFVSSLVWALWHFPLIAAGIYAAGPYPLVSAALAVVAITASGIVHARVRLETGSVWAAVALHLAWNRIIQGGFDAATAGPAAMLWVGETGILTALVLVAGAYLCSRGKWTMLDRPEVSA